jgi:hypothetical protein
MPSYILKCARDSDLYVLWSTIAANVTDIGTREELVSDYGADRVERADRTGTSCKGFAAEGDGYYFGAWTDEGFILHNMETQPGFRYLPRENLKDYARALLDGDYKRAESEPITRPLDDEE